MDPEIERLLTVLGFKNPSMKDMKMKTITSQWRRMSLVKHPDKGGRKEEFQELMEAYEKLGKKIEETPQDLYEKTRDAYYCQADEKQVLNEKIVEIELKSANQAKEILKMKRDNQKQEKNLETKIKEVESSLNGCFKRIDKYEQENVKLKEEKKVLEELRKMDNLEKESSEKEESHEEDNGIEERSLMMMR